MKPTFTQFSLWQQATQEISIERYVPVGPFGNPFDLEFIHAYDQKKSEGMGYDRDPLIAFTKAVGELAERRLLRMHRLGSSNGCAFHVDARKARDNAEFELIERDSFFLHFWSTQPFSPMKWDASSYSDGLAFLRRKGIRHRLYRMETGSRKYHSILSVFTDDKEGRFGMIMGSACHRDLEVAQRKAFLESAFLFTSAASRNFSDKTSLAVFLRDRKFTPLGHFGLGLSLPYARRFFRDFLGKDSGSFKRRPLKNLVFQELATISYERVNCAFVRTSAPMALAPIWGSLRSPSIIAPIKTVLRHHGLQDSLIPKYPHPFP